ncbi:MAG: hypothetical protein IPK44_15300 [Candidatus Accumulibacter sp.]|uniref:hypothetical protein n=1 Tax=Accumulibacter sp. TaxID=2053492 RepID=UPI0025868367|nr:hypothetical protein [Accumulibacter sp.]MBK8115755.1 hypothetical protein [Accumulibacter sp.]
MTVDDRLQQLAQPFCPNAFVRHASLPKTAAVPDTLLQPTASAMAGTDVRQQKCRLSGSRTDAQRRSKLPQITISFRAALQHNNV